MKMVSIEKCEHRIDRPQRSWYRELDNKRENNEKITSSQLSVVLTLLLVTVLVYTSAMRYATAESDFFQSYYLDL